MARTKTLQRQPGPNGTDTDHLFRAYRVSRDSQLHAELTYRFMPLVHQVARRYARSGIPTEDLHQIGYIGLMNAVANFDPGLSVRGWVPFNFVLVRDGTQVGRYQRVLGKLRDRYVVQLQPGFEGVDRRLVIALAIALDALQDR